jgi:pyrimidine-specific ribonucleoside hydrolase
MDNARPTIIDTDMAPDDWYAILYLLAHPRMDVKAITVTGTGEAHCDPGVRNALDIAWLAGHPDVLVSCGRDTPLVGDHTFPSSWRSGVDKLLGMSIPRGSNEASDKTAVELIVEILQSSEEKVHIVALGPLTNVAEVLISEPSLVDDIEMITIMGGAVNTEGNIGVTGVEIDNEVSEWNIYVDPRAAAVVIASEAPITLVPLDATNHVPVTMDFYRRLEEDHATPSAEFVYRGLSTRLTFVTSGRYYFWDPLAAILAAEDDIGAFEELLLSIIEEEGPESGRTVVDQEGHAVRVATAVDGAEFERLFLDGLNYRFP